MDFRLSTATFLLALVRGVHYYMLEAFAQETEHHSAHDEVEQKELDKLVEDKQKFADQINTVNQMNPLLDTASGLQLNIDASKLPKQAQWIVPILNDPKVQKSARKFVVLAQNPSFAKNSQKIVQNENLNWLYGGLVAAFVVYFLLKRKVLAATDRWWMRLILRLCLVPVFFGLQALVAYAVLGQPIVELFLSAYKVFSA
jgi:hypothetical protein